MLIRTGFILCVLLASCCTLENKTNQPAKDLTTDFNSPAINKFNIVEHIKTRTVRIRIFCKILNNEDSSIYKPYSESGWGTGTILKSYLHGSFVQTAAHVVLPREEIGENKTILCDKNDIVVGYEKSISFKEFKIVYVDKKSDVAILLVMENLKVNSKLAKNVSVGQQIHMMGYPFLKGLNSPTATYSKGYISVLNIKSENNQVGLENISRYSIFGYMGSSGAALWDDCGNIVGIISFQGVFKTLLESVPQNGSLYGVGIKSLKNLYTNIGLGSLSK